MIKYKDADPLIDYASEGLIEIESDGMVHSINKVAKKILGLENQFVLPHDSGVIEN